MGSQKDKPAENTGDRGVFKNDTNPESSFIRQKCKRLASALYAVTRLLPDDEPIRQSLRSQALDLIQSLHNPVDLNSTTLNTHHVLTEISDQLVVAKDGGMISAMNHRVLQEEIDRLSQRLGDDTVSFGPQLNGAYLQPDSTTAADATQSGRNKSPSRSSEQMSGSNDSSLTTEDSTPTSAKQRRRQQILDLFAETDEITINDVTEVIDGFSRKTLQRDLKALVKAGKLEKHGKRRWSSYTKA